MGLRSQITFLLLALQLSISDHAKGEVWNCHFQGDSVGSRVEIDVQMELTDETKPDRRKVAEFVFKNGGKETRIATGYLQRLSYRERQYWKKDKPPLTSAWDGEIFLPVSNYEHHLHPGILGGFFYKIDSPSTFSLFRNSSMPEKATALMAVPTVERLEKGSCRRSDTWRR